MTCFVMNNFLKLSMEFQYSLVNILVPKSTIGLTELESTSGQGMPYTEQVKSKDLLVVFSFQLLKKTQKVS